MHNIEEVAKMLEAQRTRGDYEDHLFEFMHGRRPTKKEREIRIAEARRKREEREAWLATQPWHVRKKFVDREERIFTVLRNRYDVPEWLLKVLNEEMRYE